MFLFSNKITKKEDQNLFTNLEHIEEVLKEDSDGDQLFILLHGWQHSAEDLKSVGTTILEDSQFQQATVIIPELKIKNFFSISDIYIIVREIVFLIDNFHNSKPEKFKHIYFLGHSAGALIARKVYLCAYGEILDQSDPLKPSKAPFETIIKTGNNQLKITQQLDEPLKLGTQKDWVKKVNRIILLAGMNMGWTASPAFRSLRLFGTEFGIILDTIFSCITQKFFIFQIRRGSKFITNLRFQWLIMSQEIDLRNQTLISEQPEKEVLVIQLLGNKDDFTSPQDNIDYVTGKHFYYKDVPDTTHKNIIEMNDNAKEKYFIFKRALIDPDPKHSDYFHSIGKLYDRDFIDSNRQIKNVIFVIHGIRDEGFWTNRVARKIKKQVNSKGNITWASETSSYGYFTMLPFLFPYLRSQKVEWLMDKYIENRSLYPDADFHYVGHSNGTYLAAEALEKYSFCRFQHIVFAGSVVDSNYDWKKRIKKKQVKKILNFVATNDWVVAIFPNFFETWYRWNNLGGAGHKGFQIDKPLDNHEEDQFYYETNREKNIHQLKYIRGGHGAAIQEDNWDVIIDFIVKGEVDYQNLEKALFANKRESITYILGIFAPLTWLMILLIIAGIGIVLIPKISLLLVELIVLLIAIFNLSYLIPTWLDLLSFLFGIIWIFYLFIIWNILTRI